MSGVSPITLRRQVDALRAACEDYALKTDTAAEQAKRDAEAAFAGEWHDRQSVGLDARDAVKADRSGLYAKLVLRLRRAEQQLATWKPAPKKARPVESFSAIVSRAVARP